MTVKEYALNQLHWMIREDPWVQEIMLAAGATLDQLAERILAIYNSADFNRMNVTYIRYYEKLLGLKSSESETLENRRSAIQAAWGVAKKPSLSSVQSICDGWEKGGIICSYESGTLTLDFIGGVGVPSNIDSLISAIEQIVPPHIAINYGFNYLLIYQIHEVMTINEIESTKLSNFAGG